MMKLWTGLLSVSSKKGVLFHWIKSFAVVMEGFLGHGNRSPGGIRSTGFPQSSLSLSPSLSAVMKMVEG